MRAALGLSSWVLLPGLDSPEEPTDEAMPNISVWLRDFSWAVLPALRWFCQTQQPQERCAVRRVPRMNREEKLTVNIGVSL